MALVRCTCVTRLEATETVEGMGNVEVVVLVADPECGYVVHRMVA